MRKLKFNILFICLFFTVLQLNAQKFFSVQNSSVPPARTNALNFDGVNDYVNLGNYSAFTGNYTVEAWVYLTPNSHNNTILGKFNGGVAGSMFLMIGADNKITAQREVNPYSLVSNNAIPDNTWTHVAMTYDGTNLRIYINGVLDIAAARGAISSNTQDVLIGAKKLSNSPVDFFEGTIGDLRIWTTARLSTELQQYMFATLSGTEAGLLGYFDFNQGAIGQNNSSVTTLVNEVPSGATGTLTNFTLTDPNISNWVFVPEIYKGPDGLTAATASSSAYQIKRDYPNSPDGIYWIKNININSGTPFQIYADMTTDGGGWTLILKNSTYVGWTYANAIALNNTTSPNYFPFTSSADIISTTSPNYSIIGWADYIKKSATGFQYMLDAETRRSNGAIYTVNNNVSFTSSSNTNTIASGAITLYSKFGTWSEADDGNTLAPRMPWYSNGLGFITTDANNTSPWWGSLVTDRTSWVSAPWISGVMPTPSNIWYWVR